MMVINYKGARMPQWILVGIHIWNEKFIIAVHALEPLGKVGEMGQERNLERKVGFWNLVRVSC